MMFCKYFYWLAFLAVFGIGCGPPAVCLNVPKPIESKITSYAPPAYLLGPGDKIEVIYRIGYRADTTQYIIGIGDLLAIEFYSNIQLNRSLYVLPDGTITLPSKGIIKVIGQTPQKLADSLTGLFSNVVRDPMITVTVKEYNKNAQEFIRAVTNQQQGQAKTIQIGSDGMITFPFLDEINAIGLTISQLKELAYKKYAVIIPNLTVSLSLTQPANNVAYVMSEVRKPGLIEINRPTTITQLISQAQVDMNTANLKTVAVLSLDKDHKPVARLVDVNTILKHGNIALDVMVAQYDVVFVPKRPIASAELFVQQYLGTIYGIVPDFFNMGINADYKDILNTEIVR
jgi:polysaccharide export outer membrane protein